jgi:hypothetical protein
MARRDLTRDEVTKAERPAWARGVAGSPEEYYYDGIYFWHVPSSSVSRAVREDDTPLTSWRHRVTCNCALCRADDEARSARAAEHGTPPG